MTSLNGRVAWVTGGARGIGAAIAGKLREQGARVFATDRVQGDSVDACDALRPGDLARYAARIFSQVGRLDILVNNAGVQLRRSFVELSADDYETVFGVNVKGAFFASQAVAKVMVEARCPGVIVNVCSVNAERARPETVLYCASKGAIRSMTKALAFCLGKYGIRVNSVAPGTIQTELNRDRLSDPAELRGNVKRIALGRLGMPSDVAPAVAFLVSDEAAYITGTTVAVHGGWTLSGE